jgi:hypothetical protein
MKLTDLNVLVKICNDTLKIMYIGKYEKCVLAKNPEDNTELILRVDQVVNLNIIIPE